MNNPQVKHILGPDHFNRTVTHEGHLEYIGEGENRITVLYVTGTPYEMGCEQGRLLAEPGTGWKPVLLDRQDAHPALTA